MLWAAAFVILDLLAFENGVAHVFRHRDALDAVAGLIDEFFAQLLQDGHLALEFRLRRTFIFLFEFGRLEAASSPVWIWHDI